MNAELQVLADINDKYRISFLELPTLPTDFPKVTSLLENYRDEVGEVKVRIDGAYLTEALRACGGMVDFRVTDGKSPVVFAVDGYQLVVMPMLTADSQKPEGETQTAEPEPEAEDTEAEQAEKTEAVAEAEAITKAEKPKRKRSKAKEPVAVA